MSNEPGASSGSLLSKDSRFLTATRIGMTKQIFNLPHSSFRTFAFLGLAVLPACYDESFPFLRSQIATSSLVITHEQN
jgi:hypothetical protein